MYLTIEHDFDCEAPELGFDVTYRAGSRYRLGTIEADPDSHFADLLHDETGEDVDDIGEDDAIDRLQTMGWTILPAYAYIHGGVALSLATFSCPWDSGQFGFIVVSPEQWRALGVSVEHRDRYIQSAFQEWAEWLAGNVYGYRITDDAGDEVDSCWGFIGTDAASSGMSCYLPPEANAVADEAFSRIGTPIPFQSEGRKRVEPC